MELAPVSALTFEVTFDSSELNVAMSVYDTTSGSPVLVQNPTAMANLVANTYIGKFTPTVAHEYVIYKAVYTDDTYETLDTDYAAGTESIICENVGSGSSVQSSGCSVIGFVQSTPTLIGIVVC